jgi:hypothetical protein
MVQAPRSVSRRGTARSNLFPRHDGSTSDHASTLPVARSGSVVACARLHLALRVDALRRRDPGESGRFGMTHTPERPVMDSFSFATDVSRSGITNGEPPRHRRLEMDRETLRLLIQRKLRDGRLPHDRIARVWSGRSHRELCVACDTMLSKEQLLMEGTTARSGRKALRFHVQCFQIWDSERRSA